jgi:hypothetical protein
LEMADVSNIRSHVRNPEGRLGTFRFVCV